MKKVLLVLLLSLGSASYCDAMDGVQSDWNGLPSDVKQMILAKHNESVRDLLTSYYVSHEFQAIVQNMPVRLENFEGVLKDIPILMWIVGKFNNVVSLDLSHFASKLNDHDLEALSRVPGLGNLRELSLANCRRLTHGRLTNLHSLFPHLESLNLYGCKTDWEVLDSLTSFGESLRKISVCDTDACDDVDVIDDLDTLSRGLPLLESLVFSSPNHNSITALAVEKLLGLQFLRTLKFDHPQVSVHPGVGKLWTRFERLECLMVPCPLEEGVRLPPKLMDLTLANCKGAPAPILQNLLHPLVELRNLTMFSCDQITGEGFLFPRHLKAVKLVDCPRITREGLKNLLGPLRDLHRLELCRCNQIVDEGIESVRHLETLILDGGDLIGLNRLENLRRLELSHVEVHEPFLHPRLTHLVLNNVRCTKDRLRENLLVELRGLDNLVFGDSYLLEQGLRLPPQLRHLSIFLSCFKNEDLQHLLAPLERLRTLDIGGWDCRSQPWQALRFPTHLQDLRLFAYAGSGSDLPPKEMKDSDLQHLLNPLRNLNTLGISHFGIRGEELLFPPSLRRLMLNSCPVTNSGLQHSLTESRELECLELVGCSRVSKEAIVELVRLHPRLRNLIIINCKRVDRSIIEDIPSDRVSLLYYNKD